MFVRGVSGFRVAIVGGLAALAVLVGAPAAEATFPGANGKLVSSVAGTSPDECLQLIDPASGARTQPGECGPYASRFRIAPDGTRVVSNPYDVDAEVYDMRIANLDGSGVVDSFGF